MGAAPFAAFCLPPGLPPPGEGMGKPGFPIPLRKGCARTFPGAGAWGNLVSPSLPSPPPLGAGVRLLPPAGGGWEGGSTLGTMVTSGPMRGAHHAR